MKLCPVGAELFHADSGTDKWTEAQMDVRTDKHDEANIRFSKFCERAQILNKLLSQHPDNTQTTRLAT